MSSGSAFKNLLVGLFFLGGLAVLGGATLAISNVPFLTKSEQVEVRFPKVDNLQPGDDVLLHGFRVGQVDDIQYVPLPDPSRPIRVLCSVPMEIRAKLNEGTKFVIHSAGPLGGRFLEITPPAQPGLPGKSPYEGEAPGDLFRQLESLVSTNQESITAAVEGIRSSVDNISAITQEIRSGSGLISQLVNNPELADSVEETIQEIRTTFSTVNRGEGPVGVLLNDEDLGQKVRQAVSDLADVASGLKKEDGTVGYLLNSREAKEKVGSTLDDLQGIVEGIREGDGLASRLINSTELASRVEDTIGTAQEVVDKVNAGSGTIGQLINNPRAWEEVMKVLILVREAVEDLREQAPISTFVNVLFATF